MGFPTVQALCMCLCVASVLVASVVRSTADAKVSFEQQASLSAFSNACFGAWPRIYVRGALMEEAAPAPQPQVSEPAAAAENAATGDPLSAENEPEEERENAGDAQVVDLVSEDSNDCTPGKRARDQVAELQQRAAAAAAAAQSSVDFGSDEALSDCPICFEPWGSSGDHRVCCLACGHLFGLSCIQTWLRST